MDIEALAMKARVDKWTAAAKKDLTTQQIFVCLYLCPGHCETDPTCPWKPEGDTNEKKTK